MEPTKKDPRNRFSTVLGRLRACDNRVKNLLSGGQIKDTDEIWEAYCELEEGIALSNFVTGAFERLGKRRKLTISLKDDPVRMTEEALRKKFSFVGENLEASMEKFSKGDGEAGAESARRARDVLKTMLIAHTIAEKRNSRKSKTSAAS